MAYTIGDPNLTQRLVAGLELKGKVLFDLDDRVVPVVQVADVVPSGPPVRTGGTWITPPAVVGSLGVAFLVPADGFALSVHAVRASLNANARLLTAAQLSVLVATQTLRFLAVDSPGPSIPVAAGNPTLNSSISASSAVAESGSLIDFLVAQERVTYVPPFQLDGAANTNPAALAVWHTVANTAFSVRVWVTERAL